MSEVPLYMAAVLTIIKASISTEGQPTAVPRSLENIQKNHPPQKHHRAIGRGLLRWRERGADKNPSASPLTTSLLLIPENGWCVGLFISFCAKTRARTASRLDEATN